MEDAVLLLSTWCGPGSSAASLSSEIRVLVDLQSDASGIGTCSYWLTMRVGLQRTGPSFTHSRSVHNAKKTPRPPAKTASRLCKWLQSASCQWTLMQVRLTNATKLFPNAFSKTPYCFYSHRSFSLLLSRNPRGRPHSHSV